MIDIHKYIDHTALKAETTEEDIIQLCEEAQQYEFYAVCVNSGFVSLAKKNLSGTEVKICSVVGFPLGAMSTRAKVYEAEQAVRDGASEIDMVINIGYLRAKQLEKVEQEIEAVKKAIGDNVLKVIIETCYLSRDEVNIASRIAVKAGADFVKTSTGFGTGGAERDAVDIILRAVEGRAKVKASGGIKNLDSALKFIEQGVDRIGTSSGISIVKELNR